MQLEPVVESLSACDGDDLAVVVEFDDVADAGRPSALCQSGRARRVRTPGRVSSAGSWAHWCRSVPRTALMSSA
ncbi:hypothetical protein EBO15_08185 [Actinomadura harenae]|uniref:Uncharacterized protein n=1 Tax=Actinomadura harenae TaxID=2483351 RepID=A0A3M2M9N5_9ACTN|nr:hypothetical protein EBO15_08185 [Actinomadura harenae]